ncbi:putative transmembrane protein INAFM2 isoform X1 [Macrosteles quadrilineatus]|uniref:putative transmembrane protein INAFM2 isoform X1 n=1 Tax=Macrosteles quadrilineatus TaxID=74068 RepID=UPI0023E1AD90|nr:putative transmembrane protein INAFM2 isoform X1 [Macrosteles quadrilineatus]XP_054258124.1 putative transmembrane protein INAFM2 isoform X1 [Macrosteles quadrilineatus]XP_054258126.1 putative transmembrane protein INAFM2 isoform X1 [Macrosteles quadrilineatus]
MSGRSTTQSAGGSVRGSIKFAGEEAKDRLYEPKHKKKVVRVLTVIAYVFSVSLAAIMLSLYYIFIWQGTKPGPSQHSYNFGYHGHQGECRHQVSMSNNGPVYNDSQMAETPRVLPAMEELSTSPLPPSPLPSDPDYVIDSNSEVADNYSLPLSAHINS